MRLVRVMGWGETNAQGDEARVAENDGESEGRGDGFAEAHLAAVLPQHVPH